MTAGRARHAGLERLLATVLSWGTWLASGVVALGLALPVVGRPEATMSARIVTAGIALFILLPALRVLLMLIAFIRERDYRFGAIAMLVLMIMIAGVALGVHMAGNMPG